MSIATRAGMKAQPESTDQTRRLALLVANGTVQLPRNLDLMPDRVFTIAHSGSARVNPFPPLNLSPVRVYTPARRRSVVVLVPVEVQS